MYDEEETNLQTEEERDLHLQIKEDQDLQIEEEQVDERWENAKNMWKGMTKKEKKQFVLITSVILVFFGMIIAGGIVMGLTNKPWLLIAGVICFIGFGLSFPIANSIQRNAVYKSIRKDPMAIVGVATITSVNIGWQVYSLGKLTALTLNITCEINGMASKAWYKFSKEELKNFKLRSFKSDDGREVEIDPDSIDNAFKRGDNIVVKYIMNNPKFCILIEKAD